MIPRVIHYTVPAKTNAIQEEAIQRARDLHPEWTIRVWRDPLDPKDFRLGKYWGRVNSGAQLADLIRLEVVLAEGGVYLDSDITMLRPMSDILEHSNFCICSEDGVLATNAMFAASKGSPVLSAMIENLLENEPDWTLSPVITTGPEFMTRLLVGRTDYSVLPRESFYPYLYNEARKLHTQSHGCHEWAGSWTNSTLGQKLNGFVREMHPKKVLWKVGKAALSGMESNAKMLGTSVKNFGLLSKIVPGRHMPHHIALLAQTAALTNGAPAKPDLSIEIFLKQTLKGGDFVVHCGPTTNSVALMSAHKCGRFGRSIHLRGHKEQESQIRHFIDKFALSKETVVFTVDGKPIESISQVMPYVAPIAAIHCVSPDDLKEVMTTDEVLFESKAVSVTLISLHSPLSAGQKSVLETTFAKLKMHGYNAVKIDSRGKLSTSIDNVQALSEMDGKTSIAFVPILEAA
jgi:Glycosyltransferase sugar-binding region containing DXD motif